MNLRKRAASLPSALTGAFLLCLLVSGCRHRHVQAPAPPPPPVEAQPSPTPYAQPAPPPRRRALQTQIGIASWYGAPYHNARGANGQIYDEDGMTAAHRTLPLGTVVRVTNLATDQSVVVTISDRGPFVPDRILDLSRAAAIKVGVWGPGTARVRIDVLSFPPSESQPGRWCVQIGAFHHEQWAKGLRNRLQREYPSADVIEFRGATGYWVRIKPYGESRFSAEQIVRIVQPAEGNAYLVRLN
ncbi:MAG: septal ring lytic transglycosylase RlpA family protein [Acidobacteriaceae bacterium]